MRISFSSSVAQLRFNNAISLQLQNDLQAMFNHISIFQIILSGCYDFTVQCIIVRIKHSSCIYHSFYSPKYSKIYRCWIVWGKNIRIVIIPSFLAITLLGQSISLHLIIRFQFIASSDLASVSFRWSFK